MKKFLHFLFLSGLSLFALINACPLNVSAQKIAAKVKRIVFLGNSITWAGGYVNDIEAYFVAHYPDRKFEFINVGLSSETVSGLSEIGHANGAFPRPDLHERLSRVLAQTKPDLVIADYGMNDGIYQPYDSGRFRKFKEGIFWLHDEVESVGARIIHLTPTVYDETLGNAKGYENVLAKYAAWLLTMRQSRHWEVVDIHRPMLAYLEAHRKIDAEFKIDGFALSTDGVHPLEAGHWLMAKQVLLYFGCTAVAASSSIVQDLSRIPNGKTILDLVTRRQNMMRDAWLSQTKHNRPGVPDGLPMDSARKVYHDIDLQLADLVSFQDSVQRSSWYGLQRTDFKLFGRHCVFIEPTTTDANRRWIWRTKFLVTNLKPIGPLYPKVFPLPTSICRICMALMLQ